MTKLSLLTRMLRLQKLFSDRRRWTSHNYKDRIANHTCYCLVGGLNKVRGKTPGTDFMTVTTDEALALGFATPATIGHHDFHSRAVTWNDNPKRTVKEVQERVALAVKNARRMAKEAKAYDKSITL